MKYEELYYGKQLGYEDISLKPQKTTVNSRKECDTSVELGDEIFNLPVYPANMKSVVDTETCKFLARQNYFYTMHRFGNVDIVSFIEELNEENLFSSISVGVNQDSYDLLNNIYQEPLCVDYITIDVANAWSDKCQKMVTYIKKNFPETFLIVGNVATSEAFSEIEKWGADGIKCGIAGGKVCITRNKTGVYRPMISTIAECANVRQNAIIIADGGVREHGDIAKAIACGADMVMAGSLFAGYDQSSGNIIEIEDRMYKEYYGSASQYNKGEYKNVEGKKILIQYKGDMNKLLTELKEDLQSSISYVGGRCIDDLKKAELFRI